jgi:hypothetical protein
MQGRRELTVNNRQPAVHTTDAQVPANAVCNFCLKKHYRSYRCQEGSEDELRRFYPECGWRSAFGEAATSTRRKCIKLPRPDFRLRAPAYSRRARSPHLLCPRKPLSKSPARLR